MLQTVYIARHGFRLSWETSVWSSPTGTPRDPPLAKKGVDQAHELSKHIASLPKRPQAVFSSPLYRCLQTAEPSAETMDLPIFIEFGIGEWYLPVKEGTGVHPRCLPPSELRTWFPRIDVAHESILLPSQLGESKIDVHDRANEFFSRFVDFVDKNYPDLQHVVLFTHAAICIALGRAIINDRSQDIRAGTCSLSTFSRNEKSWSMLKNGDTSFLEGGEERNWTFDYVEEYQETGHKPGQKDQLASDNYKL